MDAKMPLLAELRKGEGTETSRQLLTLLNRFNNLYQTNQETTCLELETGLPGETTPSPGAREELGVCKQAWRAGRDKEEVTPPFWW